jgi:hypothetical protein
MDFRIDFDERPFIVIWETTQACDLACVHCRARAQPFRSHVPDKANASAGNSSDATFSAGRHLSRSIERNSPAMSGAAG